MKSIIGRKAGMTQVFAADGTMYPVTVIEVLPNVIVDKRTKEKNGYEALVVGYEDKAERTLNKAELGIYKKANVAAKAHLYELKTCSKRATSSTSSATTRATATAAPSRSIT